MAAATAGGSPGWSALSLVDFGPTESELKASAISSSTGIGGDDVAVQGCIWKFADFSEGAPCCPRVALIRARSSAVMLAACTIEGSVIDMLRKASFSEATSDQVSLSRPLQREESERGHHYLD
jgi:hypothetical protein